MAMAPKRMRKKSARAEKERILALCFSPQNERAPFLFFFCPSASNMGLSDRQLLVVLKGGKS
jgi:hypothetical protein